MPRHASTVQKIRITDTTSSIHGYLHMADNEDGTLHSISIDISKEGTLVRAMCNCFASCINKGMESGIPLKAFVDEFKGWRFPPCGDVTGSPNVSQCTSILDYIMQELEARYLKEKA